MLHYQNPCEGKALFIRWDRSGLRARYRLERRLKDAGVQTASLVYEGAAISFTDTVPIGAQSVQYRLTDDSGNEQEGELLPVRQSGPPCFLTEARALGKRCRAFSVPYEAEDTFPGALLTAQVLLDTAILETVQGLSSPVRLAASVGEAAFSKLKPGSAHTLKITLRNEFGHAASLSFPFTAVSDTTAGCTFYLLRDGAAIAKKTEPGPFFDYGAAGSHRYQVQLVDAQGGEVTVSSRIKSALLAPLSHPERMLPLSLQSGAPPLRQSLLTAQNRLYQFEGREYAVWEDGGQRAERFTLRALTSEMEYRQISALAKEPVLYRDPYGNCMAAAIEALPAVFSAQGVELEIQLARLDESRDYYD